MGEEKFALDPTALTAFTATLSTLPRDEIRKAKSLFIRNAIVDFQLSRSTGKTMLIVLGVMSIVPVFLVVFIPSLASYLKGNEAAKQKIRNAIDVWRDDLGPEAATLLAQLEG